MMTQRRLTVIAAVIATLVLAGSITYATARNAINPLAAIAMMVVLGGALSAITYRGPS